MSMRSIALEAGVTPMTVSLALRHSARVSAPVRERIQAIARKLGHVPNPRVSELMRELRQVTSQGPHGTLALIGLFAEAEPERRRGHLSALITGATQRAREVGFQLERFWLRAPGMTPRRLRGILEARSINGIFCLGSEDVLDQFPPDLNRFALVTHGMSIAAHIHRVASHHHADVSLLLSQLSERGYRRPGLVIHPEWDERTGATYAGAFLVFQERHEARITVPTLRMANLNGEIFRQWLKSHQPDVIVINQPTAFYGDLEAFLKQEKIRIPRDLGVATLGVRTGPAYYAGVGQDMQLIGRCAIDMLMGRIGQRDFGFPKHPKTEFVEGQWFEGRTIRSMRGKKRPEA